MYNNYLLLSPIIHQFPQGVLLFNPNKKHEVWRFLTYMFVHSGYFHITFNVLIQVSKGISKCHNIRIFCVPPHVFIVSPYINLSIFDDKMSDISLSQPK